MKTEQSLEDYLENILLISNSVPQVHRADVARRMNVSQPAVTKAIRKLQDCGYVRTEGMHIVLTDEGRLRAEQTYAKHCDIMRFLTLLGVDEQTAERDACLMEHVISDTTYKAVLKFLSDRK